MSYTTEDALSYAVRELELSVGISSSGPVWSKQAPTIPCNLDNPPAPTEIDRPVWIALVHLLVLMWPEQALCLAPLLNMAGSVPVTGLIEPETKEAVLHVVKLLYPGGVVVNTYYPAESVALWQGNLLQAQRGDRYYPLGEEAVAVQPVTLPSTETAPGTFGCEKLSWTALHPQNVVQSALDAYLNKPIGMLYGPNRRISFEPPPVRHEQLRFRKWKSLLMWTAGR